MYIEHPVSIDLSIFVTNESGDDLSFTLEESGDSSVINLRLDHGQDIRFCEMMYALDNLNDMQLKNLAREAILKIAEK